MALIVNYKLFTSFFAGSFSRPGSPAILTELNKEKIQIIYRWRYGIVGSVQHQNALWSYEGNCMVL